MKIAILTSPNQWFIPYAKKLQTQIKDSALFLDHTQISGFDVVFVLSYHKIIPQIYLDKNKLNLVIHASALPQGKGWSPLFWQILEGKSEVVFTLFSADSKADNGDIYLQKTLFLNGGELYEELREKQADMCVKLCLEFLAKKDKIKPQKQCGAESFYPKRTAKDSELNLSKTLESQFNLLRICDNENFPAFFYKNGKKYILKIYES